MVDVYVCMHAYVHVWALACMCVYPSMCTYVVSLRACNVYIIMVKYTASFIACVILQARSYARQVKQMLSQSTTTVQQSFCSKQIVMVGNGLSSVAIKPLNPTDKNSVVNMIFQVNNMYKFTI